MFSELLEQCKEVFKSADNSIKNNAKLLSETRTIFPSTNTELIIDPTKTFSNALSFTKAQRFKPLENEELSTSMISLSESIYSISEA
jgi:hypothetical protein